MPISIDAGQIAWALLAAVAAIAFFLGRLTQKVDALTASHEQNAQTVREHLRSLG